MTTKTVIHCDICQKDTDENDARPLPPDYVIRGVRVELVPTLTRMKYVFDICQTCLRGPLAALWSALEDEVRKDRGQEERARKAAP